MNAPRPTEEADGNVRAYPTSYSCLGYEYLAMRAPFNFRGVGDLKEQLDCLNQIISCLYAGAPPSRMRSLL